MADTQPSSQPATVAGSSGLQVPGGSSAPATSSKTPGSGSSRRPRTPGMTREELAEKRAVEQLRQSKLLSSKKTTGLEPSADAEAEPRTSFSDDIGKAFDNIGQAHNQLPPTPDRVTAPPAFGAQRDAPMPSSNGHGMGAPKEALPSSTTSSAPPTSSLSAKQAPVRNTSTPVPNVTSVTLDGTPVFFIDDGANLPAELASQSGGAGAPSNLARGATPVNANSASDTDVTPKGSSQDARMTPDGSIQGQGGPRGSVDDTPVVNIAGAVPADDMNEEAVLVGKMDMVHEPEHEDRTLSAAVGAGSQPVELAPITEVGSNVSQPAPTTEPAGDRNLVPPSAGTTGKLAAGTAGALGGAAGFAAMANASNTRMGAERAASATSIVAIKGGHEGRGHTRTESAGTVGTAGSQDTAIPPGTPIQTHSTASLGIGMDTKRGFDPAASDASIVAIRAGTEGNTPSPHPTSPLGLGQSFSAADAASDKSRSIATPRSGDTGELPQISEHSGHESLSAGLAAGTAGAAAFAVGGASAAAAAHGSRHEATEADTTEIQTPMQEKTLAAEQDDVAPAGIKQTATGDDASAATTGEGVLAPAETAPVSVTSDSVVERHASDATEKAPVRTASTEPPATPSITEDGPAATSAAAIDTSHDGDKRAVPVRSDTGASSTLDIPGAWVKTPGSESRDAMVDARGPSPTTPVTDGSSSPAVDGLESRSAEPGDGVARAASVEAGTTPADTPGEHSAKDALVTDRDTTGPGGAKDLAASNGPAAASSGTEPKTETPAGDAVVSSGAASDAAPEKVGETVTTGTTTSDGDSRAAGGKGEHVAGPTVPPKDAPTSNAPTATKGTAAGSTTPIAAKASRDSTPAATTSAATTPEAKGHTRNSSKSSTGSGRKKMGLLSKLKGEIRVFSGKLQHGDKKE